MPGRFSFSCVKFLCLRSLSWNKAHTTLLSELAESINSLLHREQWQDNNQVKKTHILGVSTVAYEVRLLPVVPSTRVLIQIPANEPGKAVEEGASACAPALTICDPEEAPGFRTAQLSPAPVTIAICRVKEHIEYLFSLSLKEIIYIIFEKGRGWHGSLVASPHCT